MVFPWHHVVSLDNYYQTKIAAASPHDRDPQNNLAQLPRGHQIFDGVGFNVAGLIQLAGGDDVAQTNNPYPVSSCRLWPIQQYNQVVPDAAERIIRMAEKQSDHRIDLERKVVDSNIRKSYIGMVLATIIALYGLYIAKEISINGNPWAAGIIAALDLGGLISVAVYNGLIQKKEREKRRETSSTVPMLH